MGSVERWAKDSHANKQDFGKDLAIDHIHVVTKLIDVSREYKLRLCLMFMDLKKAFDLVETESVIKVLPTQGVTTQYIRLFGSCTLDSRPRCKLFTTSPSSTGS